MTRASIRATNMVGQSLVWSISHDHVEREHIDWMCGITTNGLLRKAHIATVMLEIELIDKGRMTEGYAFKYIDFKIPADADPMGGAVGSVMDEDGVNALYRDVKKAMTDAYDDLEASE